MNLEPLRPLLLSHPRSSATSLLRDHGVDIDTGHFFAEVCGVLLGDGTLPTKASLCMAFVADTVAMEFRAVADVRHRRAKESPSFRNEWSRSGGTYAQVAIQLDAFARFMRHEPAAGDAVGRALARNGDTINDFEVTCG